MTTTEIEQQALDAAEGIGKVGTQVSLGIHHAVMAGGEPTRKIADLLHGTWLGHPLHAVLTDVTVGAWTMGVVFDGIGALTDSDACRGVGDALTIAGTVSAIPTALSGLADFSTFPDWSANTATLHAMANTVGVGLYAWSIAERRRGRHGRGAMISASAFGLTLLSAWLGGHLVYKEKVGTNHAESFEKPEQWTPVIESSELPSNTLKRVDVDEKGVLLYRDGDNICAIGSVCSHAGGPLQEGELQGHCVQCPWHDSVFDLRDGHIVHGPATQPQPRFEARERNGQIEIRLPQGRSANTKYVVSGGLPFRFLSSLSLWKRAWGSGRRRSLTSARRGPGDSHHPTLSRHDGVIKRDAPIPRNPRRSRWAADRRSKLLIYLRL